MSKEVLTHSESYVKKTNRIILAVGITSFIIFIFGVVLLIKSNKVVDDYEEPVFTDNDDALNIGNTSPLTDNLEFGIVDDGEVPITMTPDPVSMGQVVLGTEAKNVLTIGTNSKTAIKIDDVELAEPPFDGFTYEDNCTDEELRGEQTCNITMNWIPVIHGNVQNNFIISWHEANLTRSNAKSAKVPVEGSAIRKEDCNFCETALPQGAASATEQAKAEIAAKQVRNAVGPNGEVIGTIDEDGYVRDADGNIIGRMNANGLVVDDNGNVIGVGDNRKLVSVMSIRTVPLLTRTAMLSAVRCRTAPWLTMTARRLEKPLTPVMCMMKTVTLSAACCRTVPWSIWTATLSVV